MSAEPSIDSAATQASVAADITKSPRRPWTLQRRLMVTVIGIVSLILIVVSVSSTIILRTVLESNLDARLRAVAESSLQIPSGFPAASVDAYDVLSSRPQQAGFLLVLTTSTPATGAVVDDGNSLGELTPAEVEDIVAKVGEGGFTTISLGGELGDYRVAPVLARGGDFVGLVGLPLAEVQQTIARLLTTTVLVTAGGLLLLGAVTTLVIRVGLRPLRAVADTATRVASMPMDQGAVSISERVPGGQADDRTEIGRVGAALNTLLDHVDESLDARQRNEERMRRFVADASHELRTPLASIRGYSELSLRDTTLSDTSESALQRIQAQSIRMTTLVEDLLLLARLDEGQELVYGSVDLTQLAMEAVADARPAGVDHDWRLEVGEEPVVIPGDAARLNQVIANLLANARTHTPAGTEVTVTVAREGGDALVRVHDDGPGVDPTVHAELFERFSRADRSRARQTGGTGLGLSIAKAIALAHHGTIEVQSTPGNTTFTLRIPVPAVAPVEPSVQMPDNVPPRPRLPGAARPSGFGATP